MCHSCWHKWWYANKATPEARERRRAWMRARWARRPEAEKNRRRALHRARMRRLRYGLDEESYSKLVRDQKGRCALCQERRARLVIDHNHTTGKVRGLLCIPCNGTILPAFENPIYVTAAQAYLERL